MSRQPFLLFRSRSLTVPAVLMALLAASCGKSRSNPSADSERADSDPASAALVTGKIQPTAEERFLASRPGVFGPPPTAEEFARARVEGAQARQRMVARIGELKRLPPSAFPDLPQPIAAELNRRGCLIPQAFRLQPNNVIHGEFARPGQQDWALLCSMHHPEADGTELAYTTDLLVFWNGLPTSTAQVDSFPDTKYLDSADPDHPDNPAPPLFTGRSLSVATQDYILDHARRVIDNAYPTPDASGVVIPDPLDHQGINDGLWDKASTVHYFFEGKWLVLPGAD